MKKSLFISCLAALLVACTAQSDKETDKVKTGEVSPEFAQDATTYHEAAEKLVAGFTGELREELMAALSGGDAVGVIEVCATKAPEIAAAHSAGGWSIRRVSDRSRNPDNRATTTETVILLGFADTAVTPPFVETWEELDSLKAYRYYKPIRTEPLCLKCHGDLQTLAPGVMDAVKKRYPSDRATGYKAGELRGMLVVEATWPDGKAHAEELVRDSLSE